LGKEEKQIVVSRFRSNIDDLNHKHIFELWRLYRMKNKTWYRGNKGTKILNEPGATDWPAGFYRNLKVEARSRIEKEIKGI
jgi:hypothetical protein